MDHNETPKSTASDFAKFVGKQAALSAVETAGGIMLMLVAGLTFAKVQDYRNARKARKALMQD